MAKNSYMQNVLKTVEMVAERDGGEATVDAILRQMNTKTANENKKVFNTLSQLFQAERIGRIRPGVYITKPSQKVEKREVMWRLLRMRRIVTANDLVEMADVSVDYAKQWLSALSRLGVVVPHSPTNGYRLVKDSIAMPEIDENAIRYREIRRKKKELIGARLNSIIILANQALENINSLEIE